MSRLDHATVEICLDGHSYTLKPTLKAYQRIDRRFGGFRNAMEMSSNLSIDAMAFIVVVGAGLGSREEEKVKEQLFFEGTVNALGPIVDYVAGLSNPTGKEDTDDDSAEEPEPGES